MSDDSAPLTFDDFLDCFFTCSRIRIRRFYENHKLLDSMVVDAATWLAWITTITMFIAGDLNESVEPKALRCSAGKYEMPFDYPMLNISIFIIVLELLCKCIETKNFSLSKCVALFCYVAGIVALFFFLPTTPDCDTPRHSGHHAIMWGMGPSMHQSKVKDDPKPCTSVENHSAIHFLRRHLMLLWIGCGTFWLIGFFVCYRFVRDSYVTAAEYIRSRTITRNLISNGPPVRGFGSLGSPSQQHSESTSLIGLASTSQASFPSGVIAGVKQRAQADMESQSVNVESSSRSPTNSAFYSLPAILQVQSETVQITSPQRSAKQAPLAEHERY